MTESSDAAAAHSGSPEIAPSAAHSGVLPSSAITGLRPRNPLLAPARVFLKVLGLPFSFLAAFRRRPLRFLVIAALLALIVVGAGLAGLQLWANSHFRAAKAEMDKYHHAEARRH